MRTQFDNFRGIVICLVLIFCVTSAYGYPPFSSYVYCADNPIKYIDPDGMDVWEVNQDGVIINRIEDKTQDAFYMVSKDNNDDYQRTYTTYADGNKEYNSIHFEYGTVESQKSYTYSPDGQTIGSYDVYKVRGDDNGTALFEFMGNSVTGSSSKVEFGQIMTGVAGDNGLNFITTSHTPKKEAGLEHLITNQVGYGYTVREINHTHPNTSSPSQTDINSAGFISSLYRQVNQNVPRFNIYYVPGKQKISY